MNYTIRQQSIKSFDRCVVVLDSDVEMSSAVRKKAIGKGIQFD